MTLKRIFIFISICLLFLSSCSNSKNFYTQAVYFNKIQMQEQGFDEKQICLDEYTQIYKDDNGFLHYFIYPAPLEKENCKLQTIENGFLYSGNFVKNYFPDFLSDKKGVDIISNSQKVSILSCDNQPCPAVFTNKCNVFGEEKECILYKNVLGNNTEMICYATQFGLNFELVINEKPKINKLHLKINIPEVIPNTNSLDYITMNTLYGKTKLQINAPLAVCDYGWNYQNSVKLVNKENDTYTIEYTINKELYKNNESYPLILNQSIYIYTDKQPDTSVYEKTDENLKSYLSPYIFIGKEQGITNTYIRFENLGELNIDHKNIVSAKYVFRNLFDITNKVNISIYAVTGEWCSINTRWYSLPTNDSLCIDSINLKGRGDYSLNITSLIKEMIEQKGNSVSNHSIQKGFMIKTNSNKENCLFPTGDNGVFSPYLELVVDN